MGEDYAEDHSNYFEINVDDRELMEALSMFSSHYDIKGDFSGGKLGDYELIDRETGESLGQMTAEELHKAFDPTYGKEIIERTFESEMKLSEFEEGKLYKMPRIEESPFFVNDTESDLLVHIMSDWDYSDFVYAYPAKDIKEIGRPEQFIIMPSDSIFLSVEKLTADMLSPDSFEPEAAFVNGLKKGEAVEIGTASIMVNAGDTDIDIKITPNEGKPIKMTVKAGEIYPIDFMKIESVIIR